MFPLSPIVLAALNDQIAAELYAHRFYLALASWADQHAFAGLTAWARAAADEEATHAKDFIDYTNDRGAATIHGEASPIPDMDSYVTALERALHLEHAVADALQTVARAAREASDEATALKAATYLLNEQTPAIKELSDVLMVVQRGAPLDLVDREIWETDS